MVWQYHDPQSLVHTIECLNVYRELMGLVLALNMAACVASVVDVIDTLLFCNFMVEMNYL